MLLLTTVMLGIIISFLFLGFALYLVNAPYEHYREVRKEAEKWLAKLNSQMNTDKELRTEIERLKGGPSDGDLAELVLSEMERNKGLKGMQVGYPEHKFLDAIIERLERLKVKNLLTDALYELRQRTWDQEKLAELSGARQGQYAGYYVPALTKAEAALREFTDSLTKSDRDQSIKNNPNQ